MTIKTLGCSLTYGHGLPDCISPGRIGKNAKPSKYAWPAVLQEITGIDVENHSKFGTSIKRNCYWALERVHWRKGDIAIFLWPHKDRSCLIHTEVSISDIGHWANNDISKNYFLHYNSCPVEVEHDALLRIISTNLILENRGVKCYHLLNQAHLDKSNLKLYQDLFNLCRVIDVDNDDFDIMTIAKRLRDYGGDAHPGKKAHKAFAQLIYRNIKDEL